MRQKIIHLKKKFNKNNPGFRSCNIDDESTSTSTEDIKNKNKEKNSDPKTQRPSYKFNDDFSQNCKDNTICSSLNSVYKEDYNNKSNGNPEDIININIQKSDSKKMDINNDDEGKFQKKINISQILKISSSSKSKGNGSEKDSKNNNMNISTKITSKKTEQIKKRSSESKRNSKENSIQSYKIKTTSESKRKKNNNQNSFLDYSNGSKRNRKDNNLQNYSETTTSESKRDDKQNSKEKFKKLKENKEEKLPKNKIKNFNIFHSILITFIYLIFGHFFIPVNIYLIESNMEKSNLILISIILIIIPFFFIQIFFNLVLLIFYIKIFGYKSFLSEFYYNIKMKKNIYNINLISYNAYHILAVLFLGTFWKIIKFLENKKFIYIIGIIFGLIILPLHIIINPILLFKAIKNNKKYKSRRILRLKEYINDI